MPADPALATTYAIAVDLRRMDTGAVLGVALLVPSERYVSFLAEGSRIAVTPSVPAEAWRAIQAWTAEVEARLPAKPAPLPPPVVAAILGTKETLQIRAERFAAIPIPVGSRDEFSSLADQVLPGLLTARNSAA